VKIKLLAVALLLTSSVMANATEYTFSFTSTSGESGSGDIYADSFGDLVSGKLDITSGLDAGLTFSLYSPNPGVTELSPSGWFTYDNIIYPGSALVIDSYGLLFTGNNQEINLWGYGSPPYSLWIYDGTANQYIDLDNGLTFNLSDPVPEPEMVSMFALGLLGLGITARKKA
jgi:hypothetical protein